MRGGRARDPKAEVLPRSHFFMVSTSRAALGVCVALSLTSLTRCEKCMPWCVEPCAELNGDFVVECAACSGPGGCHNFPASRLESLGAEADEDGGGYHQASPHCEPHATRLFADLAALPSAVFWAAIERLPSGEQCAHEGPEGLRARGYAVERGLLSASAALALAKQQLPSELESEGPARFRSRSLDRAELAAGSEFVAAAESALEGWRAQDLLPHSCSADALRLSSASYVRTDPAAAERARCPGRCLGKWHVDHQTSCPRFPRLILMVHRAASGGRGADGGWQHGNLQVANQEALRRLHRLALELNSTERCEEADARGAEGGAGAPGPVGARLAAAAVQSATHGSKAQQRRRGAAEAEAEAADEEEAPRREVALEAASCLVTLDPGDALFFAGDVYHRTQDCAAARVALQATFDFDAAALERRGLVWNAYSLLR